jgi:hypothetical protein
MDEVIECLSGKCEILSSVSNTVKKKKRKKERKEKGKKECFVTN